MKYKIICLMLFPLFFIPGAGKTEPFLINAYYGYYDTEGKVPGLPSESLIGPILEDWMYPENAIEGTRIAVLFPHLKDPYWIAVYYGIQKEAERLGIGIELHMAGGYRNLGKQALQLEEVYEKAKEGYYHGLIIGPVQFNKSKLNNIFKKLKNINIPIVAVITDAYTEDISSKSLVSYQDVGYFVAEYLLKLTKGEKVRIAVFPGPKGTGWAPDSYNGFLEGLQNIEGGNNVEIAHVVWGDTGDKTQRHLVNYFLKKYKDFDYFIGNALAANAMLSKGPDGEEAALNKYRANHPNLRIISTYLIPEVYDLIQNKKILASATDHMMMQGMISMDMVVRIINGEKTGDTTTNLPFRASPRLQMITQDNISDWPYEKIFGERNYQQKYVLEPAVTLNPIIPK